MNHYLELSRQGNKLFKSNTEMPLKFIINRKIIQHIIFISDFNKKNCPPPMWVVFPGVTLSIKLHQSIEIDKKMVIILYI